MLNVYYIDDLPFWKDQDTPLKNALGGWQISGATFYRTGTNQNFSKDDSHRDAQLSLRYTFPGIEPA